MRLDEQAKLPRPRLAARHGWRTLVTFDSEFAPCGCSTHRCWAIPCTHAEWRAHAGRYWLRCLECGRKWSRRMLGGSPSFLVLNTDHPEEIAARKMRNP
jgi:hypothetical protein